MFLVHHKNNMHLAEEALLNIVGVELHQLPVILALWLQGHMLCQWHIATRLDLSDSDQMQVLLSTEPWRLRQFTDVAACFLNSEVPAHFRADTADEI